MESIDDMELLNLCEEQERDIEMSESWELVEELRARGPLM